MRKLNWKKVIAGTLSAVMLLSVTACGSANGKNESARDRKSTRLNSSHGIGSRMPSSA